MKCTSMPVQRKLSWSAFSFRPGRRGHRSGRSETNGDYAHFQRIFSMEWFNGLYIFFHTSNPTPNSAMVQELRTIFHTNICAFEGKWQISQPLLRITRERAGSCPTDDGLRPEAWTVSGQGTPSTPTHYTRCTHFVMRSLLKYSQKEF